MSSPQGGMCEVLHRDQSPAESAPRSLNAGAPAELVGPLRGRLDRTGPATRSLGLSGPLGTLRDAWMRATTNRGPMTPPHNVVRINGQMPSGEVWSINPRFVASGGGSVTSYTDLLTWATTVAGLNGGKVFPTDLLALLSASCSITSVRVDAVGSDGKLVQSAEYILGAVAQGTGTATKPLQTAWVVSLLTGRPGRSYRGRLYFPAWANPVMATDFRIPGAARITVVGAMKTWLNAVEASAPGVGNMSLADTWSFVTQLALGDVLDTQRRRRDAMLEQRTTVDYVL